jgi:ArsR family transcriptional regulator
MSLPSTETLDAVVAGFHALSDPVRIEVVELLRGGERCVCELTEALDIAQSRLSFHLKVLRDAGIVTDRREGRWVYYTLNVNTIGELEKYLKTLTRIRTRSEFSVSAACCG